jgi:hypothetical protein
MRHLTHADWTLGAVPRRRRLHEAVKEDKRSSDVSTKFAEHEFDSKTSSKSGKAGRK